MIPYVMQSVVPVLLSTYIYNTILAVKTIQAYLDIPKLSELSKYLDSS